MTDPLHTYADHWLDPHTRRYIVHVSFDIQHIVEATDEDAACDQVRHILDEEGINLHDENLNIFTTATPLEPGDDI